MSTRSFQPSHRQLLAPLDLDAVPAGSVRGPDAIVVPTARPAAHPRSGLAFAVRLAAATERPLVVLVSREAATSPALRALGEAVLSAPGNTSPATVVLHLGASPTTATRFDVDTLPISKAYRRGGLTDSGRICVNDVGRKRNAALVLARCMGWRTVLFLDDDVFDGLDGHGRRIRPHARTLDPRTLAAAAATVESGRHAAVGWTLRDFDDNSVVCRIRAQTGLEQEQFVGAGALLVDVEADVPFFPAIYNEDWLFLLRLLTNGRRTPVLDGGDVHQDPYQGFTPVRAASEEVGDLIGEGLLSLLATGGSEALRQTSAGFWRATIQERMAMREDLEGVVDRCGHEAWGEMRKALDAVKAVHEFFLLEEDVWVAQIRTFMETWHRDLETWRRRLYRRTPPHPRAFLDGGEFVASRTSVLGGCATLGEFVGSFRG